MGTEKFHLREALERCADYIAAELDDMDCNAGNPDGGSNRTCEHCLTREFLNYLKDVLRGDTTKGKNND